MPNPPPKPKVRQVRQEPPLQRRKLSPEERKAGSQRWAEFMKRSRQANT